MIRSKSLQWGKFPSDVAADGRLGEMHLRIYGLMSNSVPRGTKVSVIGQRLIAQKLQRGGVDASAATVGRRQKEMADWGLIRAREHRNGYRIQWEFLSPAFDAKTKVDRRDVGTAYGRKRVSSVVRQARARADQDEQRKEMFA